MTVGLVVRDSSATIAEAVAQAVVRLVRQHDHPYTAIQLTTAWRAIEHALNQSNLTPRQRELVLLDLMGLRRSQIAEVMGISPATLTTYWKAIYARYDLQGANARAALHRRLFPHGTEPTMPEQGSAQ